VSVANSVARFLGADPTWAADLSCRTF
jgi:hypothetical protein